MCGYVLCLRARQRDAAMADGSQGRFRNAGQGSRQQRPSQQVAACLCELSAGRRTPPASVTGPTGREAGALGRAAPLSVQLCFWIHLAS